jgi:hypothetical protein
METVTQDGKEPVAEAKKTRTQGSLSGFKKFIDKGGLLVFLLASIAVGVLVSYLTSK